MKMFEQKLRCLGRDVAGFFLDHMLEYVGLHADITDTWIVDRSVMLM